MSHVRTRRSPHGRTVLAAAALLSGAGLAAAAPALAVFPGANGKIAFSMRDAAFNTDIYTVNADGTGLKRLTTGTADDIAPEWSPSGTRIAFLSTRGVNGVAVPRLYTMNADGTNVVQVPGTGRVQLGRGSVGWSPDGGRIAYFNADSRLTVVPAAGGTPVAIGPAGGATQSGVEWSRDGARLVFVSDHLGTSVRPEVFTIGATGAGIVRVTRNAVIESMPDYIAAGDRITWGLATNDGPFTVARLDGTGPWSMAGVTGASPETSPDGRLVVFGTPYNELRVASYTGAGERELVVGLAGQPTDIDWQRR